MNNTFCSQSSNGVAHPSRLLTVGDVLINSWGYEQTNVDYYQVTALIGKMSVEIRAIAKDSIETDTMSGFCTPIVDRFTTHPFKKRVLNGCSVHMPFGYASKKMFQVVEGNKVFKPDRWTAYG
jgi:hypothetical protein